MRLLKNRKIIQLVMGILIILCISIFNPIIAFARCSNGFDFPLGKPDDRGGYPAGYTINGYEFLQGPINYYVGCSAVYHPGEDWSDNNSNLDWNGDNVTLGDPVFAISNGIVKEVKESSKGSGWGVLIEHTATRDSYFRSPTGENLNVVNSLSLHLSEPNVIEGQKIKKGQIIGAIGEYYCPDPCHHLHFEIRKNTSLSALFFPCDGYDKDFVINSYLNPTEFIYLNRSVFAIANNTTWHPNGTLIKGSGPEIYVLENGKKRHIKNQDILRSWYKAQPVIIVPDNESNDYTTGDDKSALRDGTLVKGTSNTKYIITDNGKRRGFSSNDVFNSLKYDWNKIINISDADLNNYPDADPISSTEIHPNGTLVLAQGDYKVYLLENGAKRWIPSAEVLYSQCWSQEDVIEISVDELNGYSEGNLVIFRDSSLIRGPDEKIYIIEDGLKRHITSPDIFEDLGYNSCDVIDVDNDALSWHLSGQPIDSLEPPPNITPPTGIKIISIPSGIAVSWEANTETNLAGYNVYISSSYENASQKIGDIPSFTVDNVGMPSFCDAILNVNKVVFISLTAFDLTGNESEPTIGYFLFGNIWGDYNDGIPYNQARVDGMDLINFGLYFGQMVTHEQIDCSSDFIIDIPTLIQKSDFNKDGRIDGFDLIELGLRFGNSAQ